MKRLLLALTLGLAVGPVSASADDLDRLKAMWQEQRYAEVLPLLESYREEAPYGRSPAVDYMIATACCQVDGRAFDGQRYFAWMLHHYPLRSSSASRSSGTGSGAPSTWPRPGIRASSRRSRSHRPR